MIDKLISERMYTDIQGLQKLKTDYATNSEGVKQEIAEQFQSMLMQMMLKSMRDANKTFDSGLFSTDQMDFYQDMFDKQLSLSMASGHNEFTEAIKRSIDNHGVPLPAISLAEQQENMHRQVQLMNQPHIMPHNTKTTVDEQAEKESTLAQTVLPEHPFSSPKEFVQGIWPMAKKAANLIGVDPKLLVAQAALETNWGKNIIAHSNQQSSHNLFNIKATADWTAPRVRKDTLEQKDGILVKQSAEFRSYATLLDSFKDYISFLKTNDRYADALKSTANPEAFAQGLQKAGYATDKNYADKILKIFSGDMLKQI
ncbi:MAG: flagellar assembly peptidoglycan hydrolase FlgJ [Gammaproteobacteria bacterium]